MKKNIPAVLTVLFFAVFFPATLFAIDIKDTRMLAQPAISATNIAFIYAEDLWVANKDGSQPRRLTVDRGVESNPVFSSDGKTSPSAFWLVWFSKSTESKNDSTVVFTTTRAYQVSNAPNRRSLRRTKSAHFSPKLGLC